MKREKEYAWLITLLTSDYVDKGILQFHKKSGCKKDFERLLNAPENDTKFSEWFYELVDDDCIRLHGEDARGSKNFKVQMYIVDYGNTLKRLKLNKFYKLSNKVFTRIKGV